MLKIDGFGRQVGRNHGKDVISWSTIVYTGAILRLGRGGTVSDLVLGHKHLFLLTLYNSKYIGGHVPPPFPTPRPLL